MHHPRFLNYPSALPRSTRLGSARVCTRNDALTGNERQHDHEPTIASYETRYKAGLCMHPGKAHTFLGGLDHSSFTPLILMSFRSRRNMCYDFDMVGGLALTTRF